MRVTTLLYRLRSFRGPTSALLRCLVSVEKRTHGLWSEATLGLLPWRKLAQHAFYEGFSVFSQTSLYKSGLSTCLIRSRNSPQQSSRTRRKSVPGIGLAGVNCDGHRRDMVDPATEKKLASVQKPLAGRPGHTLFGLRLFVKPPIRGGHSESSRSLLRFHLRRVWLAKRSS